MLGFEPELPAERVQLAPPLKVPPLAPSLHVTVPVGEVAVPLSLSVTDAVKVMLLPGATEEGFGVTPVVVVLSTVRAKVPELALFLESPPYEAVIVWVPPDEGV